MKNKTTNSENNLKAFIGNGYEEITTKKFNIYAFLFSFIHMGYRKLYTILWLAAFIPVIIYLFIPKAIVCLIAIIIEIILYGCFFNQLYLLYSKIMVETIEANNSDKNKQEIANICARKGGTSPLAAGLVICFLLLMVFPIFEEIMYNKKYGYRDITEYKQNVYHLNYELPKDFQEYEKYNSKDANDSYRLYSIKNDNKECYITTMKYDDLKSANEYMNTKIQFTNKESASEIEEININDNTWLKQTIKSDDKERTYFVSEYKDDVYVTKLTANIQSGKSCEKEFEQFKNTLRFK